MKKSVLKGMLATVMTCAILAMAAGDVSVGTTLVSDAVSEEVMAASSKKDFDIEDGVLFGYYGNSKKVVIPSSVKEIASYAFAKTNKKVEVVVIGKNVKAIYDGAFSGLKSLKKFQVASGNKKFVAYEKALYNKSKSKLIAVPAGLKSIKLSAKIKTIEPYAFENSAIQKVKLPSKVTKIKSYAFYNSKINNITLNSKLKTIEDNAFRDCKKLKSITIPKSVKTIGVDAFRGCVNGKVVVNGYSNTAKLFTIKAEKNSKAHKYAKKYGFKYKEIK